MRLLTCFLLSLLFQINTPQQLESDTAHVFTIVEKISGMLSNTLQAQNAGSGRDYSGVPPPGSMPSGAAGGAAPEEEEPEVDPEEEEWEKSMERYKEAKGDKEEKQRAMQSYLDKYPNGVYAKEAEDKIFKLIDFGIKVKREGYYFTLHFSGNGKFKPKVMAITENEDKKVALTWKEADTSLVVKVPVGRTVKMTFSAGSKQATTILNAEELPLSATITQKKDKVQLDSLKGGIPPYTLYWSAEGEGFVAHLQDIPNDTNWEFSTKDLEPYLALGTYTVKLYDKRRVDKHSIEVGTIKIERVGASRKNFKRYLPWLFSIPIIGVLLAVIYRNYKKFQRFGSTGPKLPRTPRFPKKPKMPKMPKKPKFPR